MAKLTLPIPSPVPLDVLGMPIGTFIDVYIPASRLRSRLKSGLENTRESPVWIFLMLTKREIWEIWGGLGRKSIKLLYEGFRSVGAKNRMFAELNRNLLEISNRVDGAFSPEEAIAGETETRLSMRAQKRLLREYGFRHRMPIEELFVYTPPVTEPKKLTVAEELLRFGAMSAWSVLQASPFDLELNKDRTIIELLAELAVWPEPAGPIIVQRRIELIAAAQKHLSPEALMRIGYVEE